MKNDTLSLVICSVILGLIFTLILYVSQERERTFFREELIWFARYQVVEDMYLHDVPDREIFRTLLNEINGDWTKEEIREDLQILRSY